MWKVTRDQSGLRQGLTIFKDGTLIESPLYQIPRTNTFVSSRRYSARNVLLDRTNYGPNITTMTGKTYVRDLARLLLNVDPMTFGLLKCEEVNALLDDNGVASQFQFVFEVSEGLSSPKTLRDLLMEAPRCPLNQRFQLAKQLARSVMFVHTSGFVHKNIRPETIIVFAEGHKVLGPSFLIGFERIRRAEAPTDYYGDLEWEKNLYRHPVRQGLCPEDLFIMQHDIYSLGVCLLEIGLWCSFVQQNDWDSTTSWPELNISRAISDKDRHRGAFAIKKELVAVAKERLPSLVGERVYQSDRSMFDLS